MAQKLGVDYRFIGVIGTRLSHTLLFAKRPPHRVADDRQIQMPARNRVMTTMIATCINPCRATA